MSSSEVNQIVDQIIYQYSLNPSVALSVVSSGGSFSISDTRLRAGAMSTHDSAFPNEATTEEPSVVTVTYDKIQQTLSGGSPTSDTGKTWPVYYNSSGQIQAMSLDDVKDTFLHPAIDLLVAGSTGTQQAGTYHITSTTSSSGSTEVSGSNTPIYQDSRADTTAYTGDAAGIGQNYDKTYSSLGANGTNTITVNNVTDLQVGMTIFRQDNSTLPNKSTNPTYITEIVGNTLTLSQNFTSQASGTYTIGGEAIDQPTTMQNYYLHRVDGVDNTITRSPLYVTGGNDLQDYTEVAFETLLASHIKYTAAASVDGYKITYSYASGTNRGTGMADTILTGTGDYQTHQAGGDDYRAQEFPNGTPTTSNTWYLKILKS